MKKFTICLIALVLMSNVCNVFAYYYDLFQNYRVNEE